MSADRRNGKWLDDNWACRVCDGEIPYGHTPNCDIYKMELQAKDQQGKIERMKKLLEEAADVLGQDFCTAEGWYKKTEFFARLTGELPKL